MSLRLRRIDRVSRTVARRADPFDDGIDSVAVPLGIGETLQDNHAHAFAEDRAARIFAERLRISRRRQRGCLAEAHEHEDVVERVDAARHDHVAAPGPQFQRGEVHRAEAARAGRVHDTVGPMQIKPVRNPSRHDISQKPRKRILLPRDVTFRDAIHDIFGHVIGNARILQSLPPLRVTEPRTQRNHHLQRPGHTQNAANARPIERSPRAIARVFERPLRSNQAQQLRRVDRFEVVGRDAELQRIERQRREESPAPGIRHVGRLRVRVEVVLGVPVRVRHLGDRIDPAPNVRPKFLGIRRLGKQRTETDHGERRLLRRSRWRGLFDRHAVVSIHGEVRRGEFILNAIGRQCRSLITSRSLSQPTVA